MERREFITGAAAVGMLGGKSGWAQMRGTDKLSRIAIMGYSLESLIKDNQPANPKRTLEIMDIGQFCADRFKVHNVSLQSTYLPSTEMSWLKDFKSRLAKTKTRIVQLNLEFGAGYTMGADSPAGRLQMIDLHRAWLEKSAFLECPRVLLNQGQPTAENKEQVIANFRAVTELAKAKRIRTASENRRGNWALLLEILKASGANSCVDFLNFPNQEEQLAGIKQMLPLTSGLIHTSIRYDIGAAMTLCREANYKGLFCIKATGMQGDPINNVQKIIDAVLAHL